MLALSVQRGRCEILNCCLKMDSNIAFHTLCWSVSLYYLHVTKATRARTTRIQLGFFHEEAMPCFMSVPCHNSANIINLHRWNAWQSAHGSVPEQNKTLPSTDRHMKTWGEACRYIGMLYVVHVLSEVNWPIHTSTVTPDRCFISKHPFLLLLTRLSVYPYSSVSPRMSSTIRFSLSDSL